MSSAVVTLSHTSARLRCDLQGDNDNDKDKGHSFRQLSVHKEQLGYSFEPTRDIDILRPGGGARCTRTTLKATFHFQDTGSPQTEHQSALWQSVQSSREARHTRMGLVGVTSLLHLTTTTYSSLPRGYQPIAGGHKRLRTNGAELLT